MNGLETGQKAFFVVKARLLCEAFTLEGLDISVEWLFEGQGEKPVFKGPVKPIRPGYQAEEDEIWSNASQFRQFYANGRILILNDDSLWPIFEPGDFLGGVVIEQPDIKALKDRICIVELINGTQLVRRIIQYKGHNVWQVSSLNLDRPLSDQTAELELKTISRIIWVRRKAKLPSPPC